MDYTVTLLSTGFVTHDVRHYVISKPEGFHYSPGQATEISLNTFDLKNEKRSFTFTNRNSDKTLEFTIKSYHDHDGVTHALWDAQPGDTLRLTDPFGTIHYDGSGIFLAAGAGITPFLAIFREQWAKGSLCNSSLLYSNKTNADIICEQELTHYFTQPENGLLLTLTRKSAMGYVSGRLTQSIIEEYCTKLTGKAYICGPKQFVASMKEIVSNIGFDSSAVVFEK
ncbi:flavodoxin reductase [bacterium]|nr:flavodoxin reductase [bacterium]